MRYIVIKKFRDLQDNDRIYEEGEEYHGSTAKARISELSSDKNKLGTPLILEEKRRGGRGVGRVAG